MTLPVNGDPTLDDSPHSHPFGPMAVIPTWLLRSGTIHPTTMMIYLTLSAWVDGHAIRFRANDLTNDVPVLGDLLPKEPADLDTAVEAALYQLQDAGIIMCGIDGEEELGRTFPLRIVWFDLYRREQVVGV